MSKEFNDITHALAELLVVTRQSKADAGFELAITQVVDGLVMALGSIERRLDLLETKSRGKAPLSDGHFHRRGPGADAPARAGR